MEARYNHAMSKDVAEINRMKRALIAKLVKFEERYRKDRQHLARKRCLRLNEEAMEAKHPW